MEQWETTKFLNVIKPNVGKGKQQCVLAVDERPRVCLWWSVVRCPLRNASCVALHAPLPTRHVSHQGRANSLFAKANSAWAWEACVLDQSAQSSVLAGRSSASALDRLAWLLGQVDGPCVLARDVCLLFSCILYTTPCAKGSDGQQAVVIDLGVRLMRMGLTRAKRFSPHLSPCVLGHNELGCMHDTWCLAAGAYVKQIGPRCWYMSWCPGGYSVKILYTSKRKSYVQPRR